MALHCNLATMGQSIFPKSGVWHGCKQMILCATLIKTCVIGTVTYDDFIIELNKAGLSVRRFADLLGMQPNSISNNKRRGEVPTHLAVIASLLAEMSSQSIDFQPIFARLEPSKKKPRGVSKPGKLGSGKQGVLELDK